MWQINDSRIHRFFFFYENATVFIFKKMKIPKSCIQFLYSNPFFLDTKNENWIQIQSQTSFLIVSPTKNWKKKKMNIILNMNDDI